MRIRLRLGVILPVQAIAFWPLAPIFSTSTFYCSLTLGIVGVLLLIWSKAAAGISDESPTMGSNSEYCGSQGHTLLEALSAGDSDD
jgi:hypothetical protein